MDFGLTDNLVVITGAASGMGQAAARLLKRSGAKLVLTDINEAGLSAIGRETHRGRRGIFGPSP